MNAVSRSLLSLACLLCACTQAPPPVAADAAPAQTPAVATATATTADAALAAPVAAVATPAASTDTAMAVNTPAAPATPTTTARTGAAADAPSILVHKTPTCGCCSGWVDHLRAQGFHVEVQDHDDLVAVKQRLGVPMSKASCHTAEVGGYFVEGHVPAADVRRLLAEKPKARGITAPGMPMGSPGMEVPDGSVQPYTVELVNNDGSAVPFTTHGQ